MIAAAGLVLIIGACGKKTEECNAVSGALNAQGEKIANAMKEKGDADETGKWMKDLAQAADGAAAEMAKITLTTPELQKFSSDYQTMCKEIASAARDGVAGFTAVHAMTEKQKKGEEVKEAELKALDAKFKSMESGIDSAVNKESAIVDGINKFCGGK